METENGDLDKPTTWKGSRKSNVTTSVKSNIWQMAKEENIAWNDALEFGIRFLIADKDGFDYPDCKLQEKLHKVVAHRNALMQEIALLRDPVEDVEDVEVIKVSKEEVDKEMDDVFGGMA